MQSRERVLVLDVDETLFNSVKKHVRLLNRFGKKAGCKDLPTYQQVLASGGTHAAYGHYPWYRELNERMRNAPWFNTGLEVIQEALDAMTYLDAMVAFYLTTRPTKLANTTYDELVKHGFPDREVLCRPDTVPIEQTTPWKLGVLKKTVEMNSIPTVMIDDNHLLHTAIKEQRNPKIETVLYAGPMTPRGNGEKNWKEIQTELSDNS